ncbi:MAG: RluA family pseudouridine synthase [Parcubacteria group bacterium]|nr:RluA family pseudouridine synthase [Parcubacteria group bacterium]
MTDIKKNGQADVPEPKVIYEDENFVAVNKPAGLLVHAAHAKSEEPTLVDWLLRRYPEMKSVGDDPKSRPGIVHRLDKETSGVILAVRNREYFNYLKELFQKHEIKKTYLALLSGHLKSPRGIIEKPIGLKPGTTKRTTKTDRAKMVKEAVTEYSLKKRLEYDDPGTAKNEKIPYSLVQAIPKTGRTHQIRIHFASLGTPVAGDKLYGQKRDPLNLPGHFLHAESVEFNLKNGSRIKISADLPDNLKKILEKMKRASG